MHTVGRPPRRQLEFIFRVELKEKQFERKGQEADLKKKCSHAKKKAPMAKDGNESKLEKAHF